MKDTKTIFIICPVRLADDDIRKKLEDYVKKLEDEGHIVHLPHRDTDQTKSELEICHKNTSVIELADEVHIFYLKQSQGIHFDLGTTFAFGKKIVVVENDEQDLMQNEKTFAKMIKDWELLQNNE